MNRSWLLYFLLTLWNCAAGQPSYRFSRYSAADGLSQNSVQCIFQGSNGLLWLGTQDGLNSFDGRHFKTYKYNPSDSTAISDQFILSISEDKTGQLWIGTGNGLNCFNPRTGQFRRIYLRQGEQERISGHYPSLVRNSRGEIFIRHSRQPSIVNEKGELCALDTNLKRLTFPVFDEKNRLWGFDNRSRFCRANPAGSRALIDTIAGVPYELAASKMVRCIIDSLQTIWCWSPEAWNQVFFYDTRKALWLQMTLKIPSAINDISIARDGTAWISTLDGIFLAKNYQLTGKINSSASRGSIPPGNILCSYHDRQGNTWCGTANAGFTYYNPAFAYYQLLQAGDEGIAVTSAVEMARQEYWVGTSNGLYLFAGHAGLYRQQTHLFDTKRITGLAKDKQDRLWVAVQEEGLYVLDKKGKVIIRHTRQDTVLQSKGILYLFGDSRGRIFVCTENGYYVFQSPTQWQSFYSSRQSRRTSGWYVLHAFEDSKNNIWLSKHISIEKINSELGSEFFIPSEETKSPIHRTIVTASTEDSQGRIWIATLSGGLYVYEGTNLRHFTMSDGLSSNAVYGIVTDSRGRIWATTTAGINVYVPGENRFYNLSARDGLPADDYLFGALFKGSDGKLLAGTSGGLIVIEAGRIELQQKSAEAQISDVKVNGESIVSLQDGFVLQPGYKTIGFEFSIKESLQPRTILYQYRLEGVDEEWNSLPPDNAKIIYSKLPYRKLRMQVRAAYTNADLTRAPVAQFSFVVRPPFWRTNWFLFITVLLTGTVIILLSRWYNQRKRRQQEQALKLQKELQQERERISRDLHDNIGAYASALIAAINQLKEKPTRQEEIAELGEYASGIMGYLRETIWVLHYEKLTLTAFYDRFKNYASRILKNYPAIGVVFAGQVINERELSPQVSLNLFRILQEALQNACRHAQATSLMISFDSTAKITISITDDGKGIQEKDGSGYGISNMKARAIEAGFDLIIRSSETGTMIRLSEK